jgi:hypothetical protein
MISRAMKISLSTLLTLPLTFLLVRPAEAQQSQLNDKIDSNIQDWLGTYKHLHENPELSTQKKETSALVASELKKLGYEVTDHFGQYEIADAQAYGVVAVLKNGNGSTVYVRTDMDALPVTENTGLPYASKVAVKRADGSQVGVMHACGHDLHITVFLGTAKMLAESKSQWSGTVVLITVSRCTTHLGFPPAKSLTLTAPFSPPLIPSTSPCAAMAATALRLRPPRIPSLRKSS